MKEKRTFYMETYRFDRLNIVLNKQGATEFAKVSYPIRYGLLSEIKTDDYLYQYNLNGEIKHIQGTTDNWPHPSEWLKRTVANDWIYYSAGNYDDIYGLFGEYYIPCLSYSSNAFIGVNKFADKVIQRAVSSWENVPETLTAPRSGNCSETLSSFLARLTHYNSAELKKRAGQLHAILNGRITVLPPDARHVDYDVIPVMVADGCLYNCGFCRIKTGRHFAPRSRQNIIDQIRSLKLFYDQDVCNYNSIFLGQHDALHAGADLIEFTAQTAYECFDFEHSHLASANLFLFGSVDSMLNAEEKLFERLNRLPYNTYINLGLESADSDTLSGLQKPIASDAVRGTFAKMIRINKKYERIEVSANFVLGKNLPQTHLPCLIDLVRN
ncbi:radical SAM domain-containing protein, partial [Thermodesulfobacteriota bacterium]